MQAHDAGTILIVDDTPANLAFLSDALDEVGYKVLVAVDGYSAIKQLQHITPDLILLDVLMPGIDGFETCRQLKRNGDTREIPIVFMTALDDTDNIVRGFGAGAVDYVTKPICHEEVLARIATRLRCSRVIQRFRDAVEVSDDTFIVFDDEARITLIAPHAQDLVLEYLGVYVTEGMPLPEPLRQHTESHHGPAATQLPATSTRGIIDRQEKRLTIRTATYARSGQSMLVLDVDDLARTSTVQELTAAFGLTHREVEVIMWVVKGKTNRDIGLILSMSPRTVNKHLEHIYIKLGVETRTAAANKIMAAVY